MLTLDDQTRVGGQTETVEEISVGDAVSVDQIPQPPFGAVQLEIEE